MNIAYKALLFMNPSAPTNQLDPKLQETYNKVMGTPTTPQAAQPAAATPVPANPPTTDAQNPTPVVPTTPYTQDNLSFQAAIQQPPANATTNTGQTPLAGVVQQPKQSSSLLGILLVIGGIIFFVVYTFVWITIFNLPLPFSF